VFVFVVFDELEELPVFELEALPVFVELLGFAAGAEELLSRVLAVPEEPLPFCV
jgi:hypothetical protein